MKELKNIIRIDNETKRTHAWRVTFQRRGEIFLRTFSDGQYGGKKKALQAAISFRDSLRSCNSFFEHQLWVRTRLRKNNSSGIPGVGRYEVLANPDTQRYNIFWLASWVDEHGSSRKRKFYVSRYGERQAKRLAIAEREYQLQRVCAIKAQSEVPA
ncbi:MAG: hypothetical protein BWK76_24645 [Desulfobulbaceae bacterium A2]|nr:MAG: hypothetical protein BWK76_24645 [Desulfobulbaceae bacterium A2]